MEAAKTSIEAASPEELKKAIDALPDEVKAKVKAALAEEEKKAEEKKAEEKPFAFASGLPDCCTSNPESYTVLAELPNFRLVQMKVGCLQ